MIYRIKDWNEHFEVAQGRICAKMTWVAVSNRHDGKGFRRIMSHPRAGDLFAAWVLIIQVASKMKKRGLLVDLDGALTAEDLADKTGFRQECFELAFTELVKPRFGWLEKVKNEIDKK